MKALTFSMIEGTSHVPGIPRIRPMRSSRTYPKTTNVGQAVDLVKEEMFTLSTFIFIHISLCALFFPPLLGTSISVLKRDPRYTPVGPLKL